MADLFVWDKSKDQVFTVNDIPPTGKGNIDGMYDKDRKKSFTMDALGKNLTLQGSTAAQIDVSWPSRDDSSPVDGPDPATILIKNGTFTIKNVATMNFGGYDDDESQYLKLEVSNDAIFEVNAKLNIKFQSLGGDSNFESNYHIFVEDNAQFKAIVGYSDGSINFVSGTIGISGTASAQFVANDMFVGSGEMDEAPCIFDLLDGSPECIFSSKLDSDNIKLFNFTDYNIKYPSGLFNFQNTNRGKFIFKGGTYTEADFSAMIDRNLITYNRSVNPDLVKKIVSYSIDDNNMTIYLNNA